MKIRSFTRAPRLIGVGLLLLCAACALAWARPAPEAAARAAGGGAALASERPSQRPIEIPLIHISRRFRNQARALLDSPTVTRRLPTKLFIADLKTYEYLLDHLPVASKLSGLLGYGRYRIVHVDDDHFRGRDFSGVTGDVWLIYSGPNKRVYLGEGSYDTWYTPKISAKVLLAVEYHVVGDAGRRGGTESPSPSSEGSPSAGEGAAQRMRVRPPGRPGGGPPPPIATRVDIYVQTNRLVGYLMELLGQVTDKKLSELVSSAQYTSQELSRRPDRVWNRMKASGMFTPEELEDLRRELLVPAQH